MNPESLTGAADANSRRKFLKTTAVATAAVASARYLRLAAAPVASATPVGSAAALPWYRRTARWMQTNIAELDITRYDIPWWREEWKRTDTQGIVVNAGGIVAFYPTQIPFHPRAQFLGDHDLFGDLVKAAHADGIAVFARMDSNGAPDETYQAHPEWFTKSAQGRPYRDRGLNIPCINGPYYREHIPAILREIAEKYKPEGFTDNIWSGLPRANICYCDNCVKKFRDQRGLELPESADWNASNYRAWIEWSYGLRLEIWDLFNQVTRAAGGPDCIWSGMNSGSIPGASADFRDYREICQRAEIIMLDSQRRVDATGFQSNGVTGRLVHGLLGWDKLAPESIAMYQYGATNYRLASKPPSEAALWAYDGFAAGIQPWWHYVNAYQEDRRMYETPVPIGQWHQKNEQYLLRRQPVATVGIVYSQRNNDFFGRGDAEQMVSLPERGFTEALLHARIPYLLVHADDLARFAPQLQLLILPNLGTMTDPQIAAVRSFVQNGGGLIATGATSLCDQWGDPRADFALADLFGVHLPADHGLRSEITRRQMAMANGQSYLRLVPELRAKVYGPHPPGEPPATGTRHAVLRGFEETDILPYSGTLAALAVDPGAQILMTYVPPRPTAPPEMVWTQNDHTDLPGLILNERAGFGRVAYLPADLDRRYARENLADYAHLLDNLIRWTAKDPMPLSVEGPGLIDAHLYRQPGRAIVHLVNLTNPNTWRGPVEELIPVGPLKVACKLPEGVSGKSLRLLVSSQKPTLTVINGHAQFELSSILDQEVAVIE
ncbi:MAG TPA: beta-galactosidase [Opitutales bacterium]|nr:beta-galactosidase [Opitutales bacterium]